MSGRRPPAQRHRVPLRDEVADLVAAAVEGEDGRITRLWALGDTFGKARQLGAIR